MNDFAARLAQDYPARVGFFRRSSTPYAALDSDGHAAIDRGNAEALLPSLAEKEIAWIASTFRS